MLSENEFKVLIMSKELFGKIFSEYCHKSDLDKIYLIRVIPMLKYFQKYKPESNLFKY